LIKNNKAAVVTAASDIVKMLNWDLQEKPVPIQQQLYL